MEARSFRENAEILNILHELKNETQLKGKRYSDVEKLLERLEDDDDVQNVYHSLEM